MPKTTEPRAAPAAAAVLAFEDAHISYFTRAGEVPVIPGFSLSIGRGEAVGLVGESGSGKSTLGFAAMNHLGPNGRIVGGRILFEGRDLAAMSARELRALRGARMAMVYQDPAASLNPVMTVGCQLEEVPMRHLGMGRKAARARAAASLREVEFPDPASVMARYPHQLSGGQQQRVVIAMALAAGPALLILDEPTTGLDVTVEAAVLDLVARLRRRHDTAVLLISHDFSVVARVCDRIAVLYSGALVEEAATPELTRAPRHPYTRALLSCLPGFAGRPRKAPLATIPGRQPPPAARPSGCNFAPRCAFVREPLCTAKPVALAGEAGRRVRCVRTAELPPWPEAETREEAPGAPPASGTPFAEIERLTKVFRPRPALLGRGAPVCALAGLDLTVRRGETLAIVGESGSGKTTLGRILVGLEVATEGEVRIAGQALARLPAERRPAAVQRQLQIVFQNPDGTLNPSHRVGAALARTVRKLRGTARAEAARAARRLLEDVRLPASYARSLPHRLSGGERQRVAIARALAAEPALLVADEPVSALDPSVQAAIVNLLGEIQGARGMTLVLIAHDLSLVAHLADRVAVLYRGSLMEAGPVEAVFRPPFHPYTETLLAAARARSRPGRRVPSAAADVGPPAETGADRAFACPFAARCPRKLGEVCERDAPPVREGAGGHRIACHIPLEELLRLQQE